MIAWLIIRKKKSFGYQSCRFRSGHNERRRQQYGGREDSCPSPGRILHRAHRKMPSAPGKTPMPSTRLSTPQWAFEAMSIWSAIILVKMGKSVYGYKVCAQPHRVTSRYLAGRRCGWFMKWRIIPLIDIKIFILLICSPSGRQEKLDYSCLTEGEYFYALPGVSPY